MSLHKGYYAHNSLQINPIMFLMEIYRAIKTSFLDYRQDSQDTGVSKYQNKKVPFKTPLTVTTGCPLTSGD